MTPLAVLIAVSIVLGLALVVQWRRRREQDAALVQLQERLADLQRREVRARHSGKLEAIGRLAGGVAHDFNNLLTVTRGFSELLLRRLEPDNPHRPLVEEILRASQRSSGLTHQLLAFSRKQQPAQLLLDLNQAVRQIQPALARLLGEDIDLVLALDPALAAVRADAGQLDQVILNLAANARDAMPAGGRLTLTTANLARPPDHLAMPPVPCVTLAVRDTGRGMDAATRARLFEPFFTTKEPGQGTGLGLALAQGILRQWGGAIEAESSVGHGSTFTLYLPACAEPAQAPPPVLVASQLPRGKETILLVEDEEQVRRLAWHVLEECGYTVLDARMGAEAIALSQEFPDPIQILVSDVVMPGISGPELYERLAADRPGLRVLFISGHWTPNGHVRQLPSNATLLRKPFTPLDLAHRIREILDSPDRMR